MGLTFHHLHDLPILLLRPCTSLMQNPFDAYFDDLKILHCRGIEPRSPAWQARILPLNQQCLETTVAPKDYLTDEGLKMKKTDHDGDRTHNLPIRSRTPYPLGHAADTFHEI